VEKNELTWAERVLLWLGADKEKIKIMVMIRRRIEPKLKKLLNLQKNEKVIDVFIDLEEEYENIDTRRVELDAENIEVIDETEEYEIDHIPLYYKGYRIGEAEITIKKV